MAPTTDVASWGTVHSRQRRLPGTTVLRDAVPRPYPSYFELLLALFSQSACAPTQSESAKYITITVAQGTSNHGNPKLLCTPSKWMGIAMFFLANSVAHAATVKLVPGELALSACLALVFALFFPVSGIRRGLSANYQTAVLANTLLKTAARAKALSMVFRTIDWRPQTGDLKLEMLSKSLTT